MRVIFRPPSQSDVDALAASMRPIDQAECRLIAELDPAAALAECIDNSSDAVAAEIGGRVVCMFGVTESFLSDEAHPWMLCAEGIERHARVLLVCAPRFVGEMRQRHKRLTNVVHAHNRAAIRFLTWCGFEMGDEMQVRGEPFLCFEWAAECANRAKVTA